MKTAQIIFFYTQQILNLDIIRDIFTVITEFLRKIFFAILNVATVFSSFLWTSIKSLCFLLLHSLQWTGNQLVAFLHWTWIELNLLYQSIVAFLNWGIETNGSIFIIGIIFSIVVIALLSLGIFFQIQHHKKIEDFHQQNLEIQIQKRKDEEKARVQKRKDEERARILDMFINLFS